MISIPLTDDELAHARRLGHRRHYAALERQRQGRYGGPTDGAASLELHVIGAAGEVAVARYLDFPLPSTVDTFEAPDLPSGIQVKTRTKASYELLIRPNAQPTDRYVLVWYHAETGVAIIKGWRMASAVASTWLRTHGNRPPAYFVPDAELWHISTLHAIVHPRDITPHENEIRW